MDLDCNDLVSQLVLSARSEIILANETSKLNFESFSKLWEFLVTKNKVNTRESEHFMNVYYSEYLSFLLSNLNPSWLDITIGEKTFENMVKDFIIYGSPELAFLGICKSLKNLKTHAYKFQKVAFWISRLIEDNCILKTLCRKCQECLGASLPNKTFQEFIQFVSCLPDLVLGESKEIQLLEMFYKNNYSLHISKQIAGALSFCHERLSKNGDVSVFPISKLLGKMCMSGYGQDLWKHLLSLIKDQISKSALWKRLINKVISNLDDWCLDCTIDPLIIYIESPKMMTDVFGNLPLNNWRAERLFTEKFLLNRYHSDSSIPKKILFYLISDTDRRCLFDKVFVNILKVWRQKNLLKYQPFEQTYYLCQVILISLNLLKKVDAVESNLKNEIDKTVLEALPIFLNSSSPEIRQMGMIVGQSLVLFGDYKDIKFELPIEDNIFNKKLLSLLTDEDCIDVPMQETAVSNDVKVEVIKNYSLDSDDDDDDDLSPLPNTSRLGGPTYLGQCIEGLSNYEDHKNMENCLKICGSLIKRYPQLSELDIELCKRLICLEDRFNIDDFHKLKNDALVTLIVKNPRDVSQLLIEQFYEKNYNIQQRLNMLDMLILGAQALSSPISDDSSEMTTSEDGCFSTVVKDWQQIVKERTDLKTRRFTKAQSKFKSKEIKNNFLDCAGWFFYPLLQNFEKKEHLDMEGIDHMLLEKLLIALTTIIYCAINSPTSGNMAKTLLQFSYNFRLHVEVGVRKAALQAICVCFVVLDAAHSLSDFVSELHDLCSWLNAAISRDVYIGQSSEQVLTLLNAFKRKSMV